MTATQTDHGQRYVAAEPGDPSIEAARRFSELPGPRLPGWWQTAHFLARPTAFLGAHRARYGDVFSRAFTLIPAHGTIRRG